MRTALSMLGLILAMAIVIVAAGEARAERMVASWYDQGHTTASGERFRPDGRTCAHRTLPFGTRLRVTFRGRSVECRVNDRGPFVRGRHLDLSRGAARAIGLIEHGVGAVDVRVHR